MKLNKINWILSAVLILLILTIMYLGLKPDQNDFPPPQTWEESSEHNIDINEWVKGIPKDSILARFPYSQYLDAVDMIDLKSITRDIQIMDTVTGDHFTSLSIFIIAYTDSLLPRLSKKISVFNGDTLSLFMMDLEGFKYYARMPGPNQDFYSAIHQYWMSNLSNSLDNYTQIEPNLKYNFKYRFLAAKCRENKYGVAPRVTESEKIINNIADSKWNYLYQRFWSIPLEKRLFIFFLISLTVIVYVISFFCIIKKIKK